MTRPEGPQSLHGLGRPARIHEPSTAGAVRRLLTKRGPAGTRVAMAKSSDWALVAGITLPAVVHAIDVEDLVRRGRFPVHRRLSVLPRSSGRHESAAAWTDDLGLHVAVPHEMWDVEWHIAFLDPPKSALSEAFTKRIEQAMRALSRD